jgi:predicted cation transporter
MNLFIVILSIIAVLFCVFWAWFKLKDAEEGDLIDIGFGTYVEYGMFQVRVAIALIICFFVLLVGLAN